MTGPGRAGGQVTILAFFLLQDKAASELLALAVSQKPHTWGHKDISLAALPGVSGAPSPG